MANFKAVKFYNYLSVILFLLLFSANGQDIKSNFTIVDQVYRATLDSLLQNFTEPSLQLHKLSAEDSLFLRSGWIQFWAGQGAGPDSLRLRSTFVVDHLRIKTTYHEKSVFLLGVSSKLQRQLSFYIRGWIEQQNTGQVLRAFSLHKTVTDTIDKGALAMIEQGPFSFNRGQFKTQSTWTKYIEPALIISSVITVVYLFFSVRT